MSSNKPSQSPPSKPQRVSTIKLNERPKFIENLLDHSTATNIEKSNSNNTTQSLMATSYDINPPKFKLFSIFDTSTYRCGIISDRNKHLDRSALIETNRALLVRSNLSSCCENCWKLSQNSALFLAKYLTYEDLKIMRFNFDFGLGIFTGIELITLPQGERVRLDVIERYKSCSLFFVLMVVLCQNPTDRIDLIIKLLDSAMYLFDTIHNFFGFSYIIEALDHIKIKRLTETWHQLENTNPFKFNLYKNLKEKYAILSQGGFFEIEKKALIPNIYPISLILIENKSNLNAELLQDINSYSKFNEIFLTVNARYFCKNANNYANHCEAYIQNEHEALFPKTQRSCSRNIVRNYGYFVQTEFQQTVMWGCQKFSKVLVNDDVLSHLSTRLDEINALITILSNKIQSS